MRRATSIAFLLAAAACFNPSPTEPGNGTSADATSGSEQCLPGDLRACTCTDGSPSTRACLPDGSVFGECECGGTSVAAASTLGIDDSTAGGPADVTTAEATTGAVVGTGTETTDASTGAPTTDVSTTGDSTTAGGCMATDECTFDADCPPGLACSECTCVAPMAFYGACTSCEPTEIPIEIPGVEGYCFCSPPCEGGVCPDPGTGAEAVCAVSDGGPEPSHCALLCTQNAECPMRTACVLVPDAAASVCTAPI